MENEIKNRIDRIYEAIGETVEWDVSKFETTVSQDGNMISETLSFKGEVSNAAIGNRAQMAIMNVAHFKDHLAKLLKKLNKNKKEIKSAIEKSFELQVILDLSNLEKHGISEHDKKNYSGKNPKLINLTRALRVGFAYAPEAHVAISADIVDEDGNKIGDLLVFLERALLVWEELLKGCGFDEGFNAVSEEGAS